MIQAKKRKKIDNLFAKYRCAIWIQLATLLPVLVALALTSGYIKEVFNQHKTVFLVLLIIIFFFYNLTFITTYNMGKTVLLHASIFIFTLMSALILLTQVQVDNSYTKQVVLLIVGLVLTILLALCGLVVSFLNNQLLNAYIGYKNTLVDLTPFGFVLNGEVLKSFQVLRTKHEVKLEINGTWRKYQVSQLKDVFFQGATIFGRVGHIKFSFAENEFELMYKKTKTDIVVYALYYNLIRKIAN